MKIRTEQELEETELLYDGAVLLEPREWLDNALLGRDVTTGAAVYSRELLVEAFLTLGGMDDHHGADEWVSYNTERALDYMPEPKPIIMEPTSITTTNKEEP